MKELRTSRLILREVTIGDITPRYVTALNDPEVVRLTEARHQSWSSEDVGRYTRESNREGISQLIGLFLLESGLHIGNIRLSGFSKHHRRVDLGILIFDKTQWGKGLAAEALAVIKEYVFEELGLHKICADYYSVNTASARLFEKAGFEIEGVFKEHFSLEGKYVDSIRIAALNPRERDAL